MVIFILFLISIIITIKIYENYWIWFPGRLFPRYVTLFPLLHLSLRRVSGVNRVTKRGTSRGGRWTTGARACDSSLKSLPVSVVHPQTLGIACQLLRSSFSSVVCHSILYHLHPSSREPFRVSLVRNGRGRM